MTLTVYRPEAFRRLPNAVLFDTDNTLFPYEPAHRAGMRAVREKAARLFGIAPEKFDQGFDAARDAIKQRLGRTASSHSRLLYFQRMLELLGLGSQVLLALDLEQTYWRSFLGGARLFPDLKEFLDDLRIAGISTAIVTDLTAQIQFRKIVYFRLDRYFDYIVTSEEAGLDKPAPGPFELAVAKMRPAGDCLWMIGDHAENDIAGARRTISAVTLQKVHEGVEVGTGDRQPDAVVLEFGDLRALLRELSAAGR
ncbi:MAG: HAD family hydrolase [Burkholderiales bacterium]|nr:HAD family hydrolase [Burkholderiales bacterium]